MRIHSVAFVLMILAAAPAAAQLTPEQARARAEKTPVLVTVPDGTWKGRLVDIDAETVTIEPRGGPLKTLPLSGVLRIEAKKHDSPADGAFVGGLVMTLWCLFVCGQGAESSSDVGGIVVGNAVMGMVIGGVIDARHTGIVSLYKRPPAAPARKSPGVFFTWKF
jgi:hypothetical protein